MEIVQYYLLLSPDMEIVTGTAGTPAEPYDSLWGTQKVTAQRSMAEYRELALFKRPLDVRLPPNMKLPQGTSFEHEVASDFYNSHQ